MSSVYDFSVKDMKGNEVSIGDFAGKVLLIVNTATGCGFTPHYEPLEEMYKEYRDRGFEILDFPCNQFANQAPGTEDERTLTLTLTKKGKELKDKAVKIPSCMAASLGLTKEEFETLYRLTYKALGNMESQDKGGK